jgi:hypothetical protein
MSAMIYKPLRIIKLLKGMKVLGIVKEEVLLSLEAESQFRMGLENERNEKF